MAIILILIRQVAAGAKICDDCRRHIIILTFHLWGHHTCWWCGSWYCIHKPSLNFIGLPIMKIWLIFSHSINRPGDLTFDLLTAKWGHGSPVPWPSLLPIFSLLHTPFRFWLRVRHGTDRWTDRQQSSLHNAPHPMGRDIIRYIFEHRFHKVISMRWGL